MNNNKKQQKTIMKNNNWKCSKSERESCSSIKIAMVKKIFETVKLKPLLIN